ncbi:cytochrome P450 [Streptomyces sp. NBC_01716]|uniref:cytochrome P450 n=1 Tax=Streptomyces sp. NBC_01716 TaxID=2975917 RepID=UPI002E2FB9EB|nr:cytochrome P450 [Streptomyces sp. NBC_01716]
MAEESPVDDSRVWDCPFQHNEALEFDPLMLRLLNEDPVARIRMRHGSGEAWLVSRYRDVQVVTSDRRFSRAAGIGRDLPRMTPQPIAHSDAINNMDPPEHTRFRRAIAQGFTRPAVERLRPRTERVVNQLLDNMAGTSAPADLVQHLSSPLPLAVTSEMFGIPERDRSWFQERAAAVMTLATGRSAEAAQAKTDLRGYFTELAERRRREPGDDLLSAMSRAEGADEPLTDTELAMLGQVIVVASDTLTFEISNLIYTLLTRDTLLAELRTRPERLPAAIEEMLRFIPFRQGVGIPRVATEDVELSGTRIQAGDAVHVSYLNANRDGEVFTRPHELDPRRESAQHMVFGYGPHRCPGAQLARMEMQVALAALLRRFPKLRLAGEPGDIVWNAESIWRFPLALPVRW